ncbi:S1C family serine protease [Schaalia vaccimaxillae]|uniref:S1C family serine protease n=1 Tax=Schaalia vaccimaxillae TaxID=183916 RepID=UPI00040C7CE1|nr:trypsin-like peptidase domain-containing protein [Schaalia vaccimaxillae]
MTEENPIGQTGQPQWPAPSPDQVWNPQGEGNSAMTEPVEPHAFEPRVTEPRAFEPHASQHEPQPAPSAGQCEQSTGGAHAEQALARWSQPSASLDQPAGVAESSKVQPGSTADQSAAQLQQASPQNQAVSSQPQPTAAQSEPTAQWHQPLGQWQPAAERSTQTPPAPPAGLSAPVAVGTRKSKKKSSPGWLALTSAMVVTALVSVGGSWAVFNNRASTAGSASSTTTTVSSATQAQTVQPVEQTGQSADWQAVSAAVSPAVVTIAASSSSSSGTGSGVIYNAEGHIVTNYHVISSALTGDGAVQVTLADGRIYDAQVIGHDQTTDLAVIKLMDAPSDLTVANFGSSSGLAVGEEVMAIGAPLGLSNTVTTGIISALDRPVEVSTQDKSEQTNPQDPFGQLPGLQSQQATTTSDSVITNAIQVDASINPGNSGGPLFDATGAVIGINSSIASMSSSSDSSTSAGSIGLGFAIPVDLVRSVADQLIATGSVDHAVLGVSVRTAGVQVNGATKAGAEIAELVSGGSAQEAGLKVGDTIIAVNGSAVSSSKQLTGYIRRYVAGDEVTITFVREGEQQEVAAVLQSQS